MPKRTDIHKILIIGSGPIIIGQACEFDYSGSQAVKSLKNEGYEVVLINSNPATIMTDPELADRTYIEPITADVVEKIIRREKPDALLSTMGGQTGLNVSVELAKSGILKKFGVELIGAKLDSIEKAEDRKLFKKAMENIGLDLPKSGCAYNLKEAESVASGIGFPLVIRPSFTLAGTGSRIVYNKKDFKHAAATSLQSSPINEILIEESLIGWKEYELELMRDKKDNVVIVCSIENFDPMGVHTGDSITVAPAQTLTDKEYQVMRDASIDIMREIGVDTGGSNIQFALNPDTGRMVVIEMNPRVSRSSALASKATGFPIAKFAAKLAVGYTLDEIPNDITRKTPASFEPAIDYVVTKIPRFTFEKFIEADQTLNTSMKSVGEVMAIGRTFKESVQKAIRGLEIGRHGLGGDGLGQVRIVEKAIKSNRKKPLEETIIKKLMLPNCDRIFNIKYALQLGMSVEKIARISKIDKWFIHQIKEIADLEDEIKKWEVGSGRVGSPQVNPVAKKWEEKKESKESYINLLKRAKQYGFSDFQIAYLTGRKEKEIFELRKKLNIMPVYKMVDTCAAEFEAYTPYYYSTYEEENEAVGSRESGVGRVGSPEAKSRKKIMILGGGPNRIGQGIEFDYCCCHASFALRELGYETIMVNSNPETVSTDYDTSDKLFFEPLTFEDVMNVINKEKPCGIIVQLGGQTPLNLAHRLAHAGAPIIGTSVESIDFAEDRDKFSRILKKLKIKQPANGSAVTIEEAGIIAGKIGFPVLLRPSYVLGGRAMKIVYDEDALNEFILEAQRVSDGRPILIDKFLEDAVEVDVDAISDGKTTVIGGIMEHIEEAGIHSGDSACVLPPHTLHDNIIELIKKHTYDLAKELKVKGLMNIQFAVKGDDVFVLEVNPRASRTVPFVSKATGVPLAKLAAQVMAGKSLSELNFTEEKQVSHYSVKESVFPFSRFSGVDIILGPEMKSTGEVMGIDETFAQAFFKSQRAAGQNLPLKGKVFISVKNTDKRNIVFIAKKLSDMKFEIIATKGTHKVLSSNNIGAKMVGKIAEGSTELLELIKKGELGLIINTPSGKSGQSDMNPIRGFAVVYGVPCITTLQGAQAAISAIESVIKNDFSVKSIQEYIKPFAAENSRKGKYS